MTLSNGDSPGTLSCPDLGAGARDRQGSVSGHAAQQFHHACTASKAAVGKSAAAIFCRCRGHGDDRRLPQVGVGSAFTIMPIAHIIRSAGYEAALLWCGVGQP
jgi:hypothetical protein